MNAYTDSCPSCLARDVKPARERRRGQTVRHGYQCPRCRQQWITERIDAAYRADRLNPAA